MRVNHFPEPRKGGSLRSAGDAKPVNEAATAMIEIDGQRYQVDPKRNLLEVALEQGLDLPYFCWHPELGSVGACRQCAVTQFRDENDTTGRVVMACMTPCSDKTRVSIEHADAAAEMREAVIELLMTNHPHDCPVCEEGGQCHLQDMTLMSGHNYRRYRYTKRTHVNQDLGPFVGHEMNRCISCYRCVRFYREYAGGDDLNVFSSASNVYFGRAESGTLESPFSGNLAEVCPTGVFTDKTYGESYTRKWIWRRRPASAPVVRRAATRCRASAMAQSSASRTATTARSTAISCATAAATATSTPMPKTVRAARCCAAMTRRPRRRWTARPR